MNGIWILRHATLGMRLIVCKGRATLDPASDIPALEDAGWEVSYASYNTAHDTDSVRSLVRVMIRDAELDSTE